MQVQYGIERTALKISGRRELRTRQGRVSAHARGSLRSLPGKIALWWFLILMLAAAGFAALTGATHAEGKGGPWGGCGTAADGLLTGYDTSIRVN